MLSLEGTDPFRFFGRGVIQLLPSSGAAPQEGTLPFILTASATLEDGTLPFPLADGLDQNMSIPLRLQSGRALPYDIKSGNGQMTFNSVSESGCTKVALALTATGSMALPHAYDLARTREAYGEDSSSEPRNGAVVIFLDAMGQNCETITSRGRMRAGVADSKVFWDFTVSKSDDADMISSASLTSGSTSVFLRSGSNTVLLTGGELRRCCFNRLGRC